MAELIEHAKIVVNRKVNAVAVAIRAFEMRERVDESVAFYFIYYGYLLTYHRFLTELLKYHRFYPPRTNIPLLFYTM
jgi:hypothetical protein